MSKDLNVTILGAGSWGTTLAIHLNRTHQSGVKLWEAFPDYAAEMNQTRINRQFLPDIVLDDAISITSHLHEAIVGAEIVVLAIPTQFIRSVLVKLEKSKSSCEGTFVSVAKGIEIQSLKRVSEIVKEFYPGQPFAVLSGPSHAEEVCRNLPSSVVAASEQLQTAKTVQRVFNSDTFRVYTNQDVAGVELGGSLKNIIALACGIADGLGYGDNSRAALMTRGLAEMIRLSVPLGADPKTFAGLAGMGDLIVTCGSIHSRNRRVGRAIGEGHSLEEIKKNMNMVAEGVDTTRAVIRLAEKLKIEMPITEQVNEILFNHKDPRIVVQELMLRDPKPE